MGMGAAQSIASVFFYSLWKAVLLRIFDLH